MSGSRKKIWLIAIFVLSILVARPAPTRANQKELPPECSVPGIEYAEPNRWIAAWHFIDSFDGCMIYTGDRPAPGEPPEILDFATIPCRPVGVSLLDGNAIFNGSGYLTCVIEPIPGAGATDYAEYREFWTLAKLSFAGFQPQQTIFHHQSVTFGVERMSIGTTRMAWTTAHPGQPPSSRFSNWFTPLGVNQLLVEATCTGAAPCDDQETPAYYHRPTLNGGKEGVQAASAPIRFKTGASAITIGHTPGTANYFRGAIDLLLIDPKGLPGGDCAPNPTPTPPSAPSLQPAAKGGATALDCGDPIGDEVDEIDEIDPDQPPS